MPDDLVQRAQSAVELARRAGADGVWATATRSRDVGFTVRDGELEQVTDSTARGLGVRLFVDGRYSTHSTTDLRPESLRTFLAEAVALTRALQPDEFRTLPDPARFGGSVDGLDLEDAAVVRLDRERRLAWAHAMNERVAGAPAVVSATSGVSDGTRTVAHASSNGFAGGYASTSVSFYTGVTLDDGDKRPEAGYWAGTHHIDELPDAAHVADKALELARDRLGESKGPTARTTMVVDHRSSGSLLSRLLGPADGGSVQQERSFWAGRLGQKLVSEKLTLVDDPRLPRGMASRPYDQEGFAARRMPLIERGVFANIYVDTYYGNKLGVEPTTGSPSNRVVTLGSRGRDELVAAAGAGVYVTGWLGGNMDSTTGDFSFGVRGHRIEGGRLGAPVGEMNVTGNIVDLFGRLAEVGDDPWTYSSMRAPTLVFEDVQFSGA